VPELPEVETIRRQLAPLIEGRHVVDAWAFPSAKFEPAVLAVGLRIGAATRRGKYLIVPLGPEPEGTGLELVVHLGMTGRLAVRPGGLDRVEDRPVHLRAEWALDDRTTLEFVDVRRFGRIAVVDAGDYRSMPTLHDLGPEPFDDAFDPESLRQAVNRSRRAVKTQLLSQRPVAGVGNIYADEALWRAGVHPRARHLTRAEALRLRDAVRAVLTDGIEHGGTTLRDYRDALGGTGAHQFELDCYGRADEPCRRCATVLRRSVVDARSTTFCPSCQRR
jgi:formamidopyrimidine-DNA glycosylase